MDWELIEELNNYAMCNIINVVLNIFPDYLMR